MKKLTPLLCALLLFGCETVQEAPTKPDDGYNISKVSFSQLQGWPESDQALTGFVAAFQKSCARILKKDPKKPFGQDLEWGTFGQWQSKCKTVPKNNIAGWVEKNFQPLQISDKNNAREGLFTGYYEASLNGSKTQTQKYHVPLRERPKDLVSVDLGQFREDLRGKRIAGRVVGNKLKPYEDRAAIVAEKMPLNVDKTLMWVDSPVDAFFLEIQGSGVVTMEDGTLQRVGYAGQNGHKYTAIGRTLIKMGALTKDNVSMQSIRAWMEKNPARAQEVMNTNRSYVFFTELETGGPIGAEGVTLTPERSLAVDRGLYPYGLPVWLDVENPQDETIRIQRLMVAQDTGGAIKGAVRGDFFWGYGPHAEQQAGKMVSRGTMTVFVPK